MTRTILNNNNNEEQIAKKNENKNEKNVSEKMLYEFIHIKFTPHGCNAMKSDIEVIQEPVSCFALYLFSFVCWL